MYKIKFKRKGSNKTWLNFTRTNIFVELTKKLLRDFLIKVKVFCVLSLDTVFFLFFVVILVFVYLNLNWIFDYLCRLRIIHRDYKQISQWVHLEAGQRTLYSLEIQMMPSMLWKNIQTIWMWSVTKPVIEPGTPHIVICNQL